MPVIRNKYFATVLASTVHDIKNSLGVITGLISRIAAHNPDAHDPDLLSLQFEANRMNHCMMQLLVLYKIETDKFALSIDEHAAIEVVEDIQAHLGMLSEQYPIQLDIECPDDLMLFCDRVHIGNALDSIMNNAIRYCHQTIKLSISSDQDYTCFMIEDDGDGYPQALLDADLQHFKSIDWLSGSTGLGLYFVSIIAAMHKSQGKQGYVCLDNDSRLGGARFRLFLP